MRVVVGGSRGRGISASESHRRREIPRLRAGSAIRIGTASLSLSMRQVIFITGMHRSGTSLLARVVNLLGVDLGPEERHIRPDETNPRGHWEAGPLVDVNRALLTELGGDWDDPPAMPPGLGARALPG